jgi:hypothetical protein
MKTNYSMSRLLLTSLVLCFLALTKLFADPVPGDFFPQANQDSQWSTITGTNELSFMGSQPATSQAIIATTFGDLVTNDYTGFKMKFDAFVSGAGKNTTIVLSSNGVWGGEGIVIEINQYQIQAIRNYTYPGTALVTDFTEYQNTIVKKDQYNSFIIDVDVLGGITVTINGFTCPITYMADLTVLRATGARFTYISTGFSDFKMKNLTAEKSGVTKDYFYTTQPVRLISFDAAKKANGNLLNWETASEQNNSHFIVYKSTDGIDFKELTRISAKNQASKYQYLDASPVSGNNYYKLVQFDVNGKSEELGVKVVNFGLTESNSVNIYPKPADKSVNLSFSSALKSAIKVAVFDLSGKELQNVIIPFQTTPVNYLLEFNNKITSGIYIIRISADNYNHSEKLIVK